MARGSGVGIAFRESGFNVETSVGFPPGEYLGGFFTTSQAINSKVHVHDRRAPLIHL
jgi:hypothetical protein